MIEIQIDEVDKETSIYNEHLSHNIVFSRVRKNILDGK